MDITLDLTTLTATGAPPNPLEFVWMIFVNGGWIFLVALFIWGVYLGLLYSRIQKLHDAIEYVYLAVDVPALNEQSMKAVEQIYAHLSGIESHPNFVEKWVTGHVQETFSLELISIEGYIQFIIRTAVEFRDLAESAIYSQYPDAEIIQVEDYAKEFAHIKFPSEEYDLWGTAFTLEKKEAYPIRTYMNFEHSLTQIFADPMASLLESMSKLGPGEQFWLQLVLTPIEQEWIEKSHKVVQKLIGANVHEKDRLGKLFIGIFETLGNAVFTTEEGSSSHKDEGPPSQMQYLTEGEKADVAAIEEKASKIGFKVNFRIIYLAKKEVFHKGRGTAPMVGAIGQFNTLNLNAFKADKKTKTKVKYFFVNRRLAERKNKLLRRYIHRTDYHSIGKGFVLNIEEIASLYHFPIMDVKAPLVKKTEGKRGEPPATLPTEALAPFPLSGRSAVSRSRKTAEPADALPGAEDEEPETMETPTNLPIG